MTPYFPPEEPRQPYTCGGCGKTYVMPNPSIACCVVHSPGTCCHVGEVEIPAATPTTETEHDG